MDRQRSSTCAISQHQRTTILHCCLNRITIKSPPSSRGGSTSKPTAAATAGEQPLRVLNFFLDRVPATRRPPRPRWETTPPKARQAICTLRPILTTHPGTSERSIGGLQSMPSRDQKQPLRTLRLLGRALPATRLPMARVQSNSVYSRGKYLREHIVYRKCQKSMPERKLRAGTIPRQRARDRVPCRFPRHLPGLPPGKMRQQPQSTL